MEFNSTNTKERIDFVYITKLTEEKKQLFIQFLNQNSYSFLEIKNFLFSFQNDLVNIFSKFKFLKNDKNNISEFLKSFVEYYNYVFKIFHLIVKSDKKLWVYIEKVFFKINDLVSNLTYESTFDEIREKMDSIYILLWGLLEIIKEFDFIKIIETNIKSKIFDIYWQWIFKEQVWKDWYVEKHETEILTRMISPLWKNINPWEFLDIVNEMTHYNPKMIRNFERLEEFDEAVIIKTFEYISSNAKDKKFTININPLSLLNPKFITLIKKLIIKFEINPSNIVFEVLETSKITNYDIANTTIQQLKELWFLIAIDDFPEWYNNLSQIVRLNWFDVVKLDWFFIMNTYKSCVPCEERKECIEQVNHPLDLQNFCLKRINEKHDLESFLFFIKFIKILYPTVKIFAERIENKDVFLFLKDLWLIDSYQGYEFETPHLLQSNSDKNLFATEVLSLLEDKNLTEEFETLKTRISELKIQDMMTDLKKFSSTLVQILKLMNIEVMRFYKRIDANIVWIVEFNQNWNTVFKEIKIDSFKNRIPKELFNFFKLLKGFGVQQFWEFTVSEQGVSDIWDDISIRVKEDTFISFDKTDESKLDFSKFQYYWFFKIALSLKNS